MLNNYLQILIVEDEKDIRELIAYHLEKASFQVKEVSSSEEALKSIDHKKPALMVLDLMLPKMSGLELCQKIKNNTSTKDIPILMLTAKSKKDDVVKGLELGADDYVIKPFDIAEVVARVKAILRRSNPNLDKTIFSFKALKMDLEKHKVYVDQKEAALTLTEFKILKIMIQNQGRVLTRDQLMDLVVGKETVVTDRTIDVHMASLRKKIIYPYIETVRGMGYRFQDEI